MEKKGESAARCDIPLEKTTLKLRIRPFLNAVPSFLKRLFHRPALNLGNLGQSKSTRSQVRNQSFASYLAANNRRSVDTDAQDALLALRKVIRGALVLSALGAIAWVVVESAQAVGMF